MISSILESVKKNLGLPKEYTAFDEDILLYINSVFSTLNQLGVGPEYGFMVENEYAQWSAFLQDDPRLNSIKTYMYLRVRLLFDPPAMSFLIDAMKAQILELEWRINVQREGESWVDPSPILLTPEI